MSTERAKPEPIGLGLAGRRAELEALSSDNEAEFKALDERRSRNAAMGAWRGVAASTIAPQMLVRDRRTGRAAGLVENHEVPGAVGAMSIFFDRELGRAGAGVEAMVLYVSLLFDNGARVVVADVLEFNAEMRAYFRKHGFEPQVRLREHVYIAGRFWDVSVYCFDRDEWVAKVVDRHRHLLPGGVRKQAAMGSRAPLDPDRRRTR